MRLIFAALSILILIFAALLVGPSFIDWNSYKPQIVEQIKTASGYDVTIDGDLKLAVLPTPNVTIHNARIDAPRKIEATHLVTVEKAHVSLALMPLLQKQVQVSAVELVKPDIMLEVLKDGRQGWMSDVLTKAGDVKDALPGEAQQGVSSATSSAAENISLDSVKITDGKITYIDHAKEARHLVENMNVSLSAPTLKGPFKGKGSLAYQERDIRFDVKTGRFEQGADNITLSADIGLPQSKTDLSFSGIAALDPTLEVQGETDFQTADLAAIAPAAGISKPVSFKGIISANEDKVFLSDADIGFGELSGTGRLSLEGLKERKALTFDGAVKLDGVLDLEEITQDIQAASGTQDQEAPEQKAAEGKPVSQAAGLLPQTLTLPAPVEGKFTLEAGGIKFGGQAFKGILLELGKKGGAISIDAKILEMPGQGRLESKGALNFASSTTSKKDGSVTLSDPSYAFEATGGASQLPALITALAPDQKNNKSINAFKTLQFTASGKVTPAQAEISKSNIKIDQTLMSLSGSYKPSGAGKADAVVDISADKIDLDALQARMGGQKKAQAPTQSNAGDTAPAPATKKADLNETLKPLRDFELPVNLTFDLSAQKLVTGGQTIEGVRLKGKSAGRSLVLDTASANNIKGGTASVKGKISNLKALSGIDLDLYGKTSDADTLLKSFNVDLSRLPSKIGSAEAKLNLTGAAEDLKFTSNVAALRGTVDATGTVKNALSGSPDITAQAIGLKHPDFVQAMQIFNPEFEAPEGLSGKAVDFYTSMAISGQTYKLSGIKAKIGPTSMTGNITADMSGARPNLSGDINLGNLALDVLLTGKKAATGSSAVQRTGASGSSGTSSSNSSNARWSRNAIDTGWMRSADLNFDIKANQITYGEWLFSQPKTKLTLQNGALKVDNLTAGLFNGSASLNADVAAPADPKQPITLAVDSTMKNASIERLSRALSGSNKLQGSGAVNFNMDVQSAGISPSALINNLKGKADVNGDNIVLEGFDFARLARGLSTEEKLIDSATSFVQGATSGGQTQFDTLTGDYDITEGIIKITKMQLDGPDAVIDSTGQVSLPAYRIDTKHMISLKNVENLDPFPVTIEGPLDNPKTIGFNVVEEYLRKKLERKIVKELPKLLGDDVNEKLQQFGIIPRDQAPAAGTETPDATQEVAPAQDQQQQQPTAEDAIRGVLDGLLR